MSGSVSLQSTVDTGHDDMIVRAHTQSLFLYSSKQPLVQRVNVYLTN